MALTREFDSIFAAHAGELPVSYLRVLAHRESGLDPSSQGSAAWGILQVTEVVRKDYNLRYNARWARNDLLKPDVCTLIAADLLNRITVAYRTRHRGIINMGTDWQNPRFVELLTFGWNAGYSEAGGVGHVASYLAARGQEVTIDSVRSSALAAGAASTLQRDDKVEWCKSVAELYAKEAALGDEGISPQSAVEQTLVAAALGYGIYRVSKG